MKHGKNPLRYVIIIIPGLLLAYGYVPCLYADHDTSVRTDLNLSYQFNEQFRAVSYIFIQVDKNVSHYDYNEWGVGLRYQTPITWLSFLAYYQQGYSKDEDDHWSLEKKPSINMNLQTAVFDFKISNQVRYEYRIASEWHDYRIKNTLEISRPDIFLKPYAGWELFYENRDKDVMLNRIKLGINQSIGSHVSVGTYYRMDFSKINHQWDFTRQLVGFQVTIKY